MGTQLPHGKGHSSPSLFGPCLLCPNGRPSQQLPSSCWSLCIYNKAIFLIPISSISSPSPYCRDKDAQPDLWGIYYTCQSTPWQRPCRNTTIYWIQKDGRPHVVFLPEVVFLPRVLFGTIGLFWIRCQIWCNFQTVAESFNGRRPLDISPSSVAWLAVYVVLHHFLTIFKIKMATVRHVDFTGRSFLNFCFIWSDVLHIRSKLDVIIPNFCWYRPIIFLFLLKLKLLTAAVLIFKNVRLLLTVWFGGSRYFEPLSVLDNFNSSRGRPPC